MDGDDRRVAPTELRDRDPGGERNVRQELRVVQVHAGQVELQELRQVLR